MQIPIPENISLVIEKNASMKQYLESLSKVKPKTKRSWWGDGKHGNPYIEPEQAKISWLKILARLQNEGSELKNIYDFDTSWLEKWGPQGGHPAVSEWYPLLSDTFTETPEPPAFSDPDWETAISLVVADYKRNGVGNLRPRAYERVTNVLAKGNRLYSNSGFPAYTKRNKPEVRKQAIRDAARGAWKGYPAIILFRYYNGKLRFVWMFPFATNLYEGSWVQPIQTAIQNSPLRSKFFAPWTGFNEVQKRITWAYDNGYQIAASDFSSTDAHFQAHASKQVFKVLRQLFAPTVDVSGMWESIENMQTIPLLIGVDNMLVGSHGVASGSAWTNFIETIFDDILAKYKWIKSLKNIEGLFGVGDDMAWISKAFPSNFAEDLQELGASVGQIIQAKKTTVFPDRVKSLQRLFQKNYRRADGTVRGVYRTCKALNSIIYPERFHDKNDGWDSDMFCARTFTILENCVDHPLFAEFVQFIVKGNKHLIPFSKKNASELDQITRRAKSIPGLNTTYNQEKEDQSLANFESIRIASQM